MTVAELIEALKDRVPTDVVFVHLSPLDRVAVASVDVGKGDLTIRAAWEDMWSYHEGLIGCRMDGSPLAGAGEVTA